MSFIAPDRYLGWAWFMVFFIMVASLLPGSQIPKMNWDYLTGLDKIGHFLSYGICYYLFLKYFALVPQKDKSSLSGFLLFAMGLCMEILQKWCNQGRHFDVSDLLANTFGLLTAYALSRIFLK